LIDTIVHKSHCTYDIIIYRSIQTKSIQTFYTYAQKELRLNKAY